MIVKGSTGLALAAALLSAAALADGDSSTVYVNAANYGQSGLDGTSVATGYGTIQDGINAAPSGGTVLVAPGVYDKGETVNAENSDDVPARVYVTKPLTIVSLEGADVTHIVGRLDAESLAAGMMGAGSNAVRCVRFASDASYNNGAYSVLKGFTIRDGGCLAQDTTSHGGDSAAGQPGGVTCRSGNYGNMYVTDCVISNCVGVRGGLIRYGNYVRCRFSHGMTLSGSAVGRGMTLLHCLVTHMDGLSGFTLDGRLINTTYADCSGYPVAPGNSSAPLLNCVVSATGTSSSRPGTSTSATNSVLGYTVAVSQVDCVTNEPYALFAPLVGDFRIRAGSKADGIGRAEHIANFFSSAPAIVDAFTSLDGVTVPSTGAIQPGCFQKTAVAASGAVKVASVPVVCNGYAGEMTGLYAFSEKPYTLFRVTMPAGVDIFGYAVDGAVRYPDMDESIRFVTPPANTLSTVTPYVAKSRLHVSPSGNDTEGDGSASNPYGTLQKAVDSATNNVYTLILAAAGDYREGGAMAWGHTNRVYIGSDKHVRLKGAGRGVSFITGARDDSLGTAADGRGPAAMRCVGMEKYSCVQGFTLRAGYADYSPEFSSSHRYSGGLVFCDQQTGQSQICDCELTDGHAFRGSVSYAGGTIVRSIIHGIVATEINGSNAGGGATRGAVLENCLMYDNDFPIPSCSFNVDSPMYYCTTLAQEYPAVVSASLSATNCVIVSVAGPEATPGGSVQSCVLWGFSKVKPTGGATGLVKDPQFADATGFDFRLRTTSPVFTSGFAPGAGYWKRVTTDVYGQPIRFLGGKIIPGAVQTPIPTVVVAAPQYGTSTHVGTNLVEVGETLEVTLTDSSERHAIGFTVNGEAQEGSQTWSWTAPEPYAADGSLVPAMIVAPLYSTNWYVNANSGADTNDGFTPETAWKTLAKLQSAPLLAGDCVHAAAGDYNSLTVEPTSRFSYDSTLANLPARVEVPTGVTLIADEGPDVTFITGAAATTGAGGSIGNGSDAIRCVVLASKSRIEGFTIRNGHTFHTGSNTEKDQLVGGGVLANRSTSDANCGVVYGCVITNCAARRGGAINGGRIINSKLLDCAADACSSAAYVSWLMGCYIDYMRNNDQHLRNSQGISHCTCGPNNFVSSNARIVDTLAGGSVDNTIFMTRMTQCSSSIPFSNCVFTAVTDAIKNQSNLDANCRFVDSIEDIGLDANCRPLKTSTLVVDKAVATSAFDWLRDRDAGGGQRVYNGTADIGAFEYDWRGDYAADLGVKTVPTATPGVVEEVAGQSVRLGAGELALLFTGGDPSLATLYTIPVEVQGAGTLTATLNGEVLTNLTSAAGVASIVFRNREQANSLVLTYDGDDTGVLVARTSRKRNSTFISFR